MIVSVDPGNKGFIYLPPDIFIPLDKPVNKIFVQLKLNDISVAYIEDVHSLYGMSAKSNFSFGWNVGKVHTIFECLQIPIKTVQPKIWQRYLGVKSKGKEVKNEVAQLVSNLYPDINIYGARGGLMDGKSDALGIYHYAVNQENNIEKS